jgi:hypothetical protein
MILPEAIYAHTEQPGIYARVDRVEDGTVHMSVWDVHQPGWQGGAALSEALFQDIYRDGPYNMRYVEMATADAAQEPQEEVPAFGDAEYSVRLSQGHWRALQGVIRQAIRREGRHMITPFGPDPIQFMKLADAATQAAHEAVERWAWEDKKDRDEETRQGAEYGRMINAPLHPETVQAIREAIENDTISRRKMTLPLPSVRWRTWWDSLTEADMEMARSTMPPPQYPDGMGSTPSYRCYVGRHGDCEPNEAHEGCTCPCDHTDPPCSPDPDDDRPTIGDRHEVAMARNCPEGCSVHNFGSPDVDPEYPYPSWADRDQEGVYTPDCDCGHEDMGRYWHANDCIWLEAVRAAHR